MMMFRQWLGFEPYEDVLGSKVEEIDVSIQCQFTKNQVIRPARTQKCIYDCIVEYAVLHQV